MRGFRIDPELVRQLHCRTFLMRGQQFNCCPNHRDETMLCELCRCEEAHNFHHLIPRTLRSNKWFKKRYTQDQMRGGIDVCKPCHTAIHDLIPDEKELGRTGNTLDKLLAHPEVAKYVAWKRKKTRSAS